MKKLLILLLTSASLLSQTTCESTEENNNDLNTISVKKCLANQKNTNSLQNKFRQVNTKNSEKRFLTVRRVVRRSSVSSLQNTIKKNNASTLKTTIKKSKVSSFQNEITSSGLISKEFDNTIELESLLAFPKKFELVENFTTVDVVPQFKTCKRVKTKKEMKYCFNTQIINFVNENIVYPEDAINAGVNGEIIINFVIDKQGDVSNIIVTGDKNSRSLKEEVIDLIYNLPKFKPAVKEGQNVAVTFEFMLDFSL